MSLKNNVIVDIIGDAVKDIPIEEYYGNIQSQPWVITSKVEINFGQLVADVKKYYLTYGGSLNGWSKILDENG